MNYNFDICADLNGIIEGRIELQITPGKDAPECRNPSSSLFSIPPEEAEKEYKIFLLINDREIEVDHVTADRIFSALEDEVARAVKFEDRQRIMDDQIERNIYGRRI